MAYEPTTKQRVKRGDVLDLGYTIKRDGTAIDVSGWTGISAELVLGTNTAVWTGSISGGEIVYGADGSGDGTDGVVYVKVDTNQAIGLYTLYVRGESSANVFETFAIEPIAIEFNPLDRS